MAEDLLTLPVGHPLAGYAPSDHSEQVGTGTLPPEEQAWHDKRDQARDDLVDEIAEAEDKAARATDAETEPEQPGTKTTAGKTPSQSSGSSSG